jgi:hypothetical protein
MNDSFRLKYKPVEPQIMGGTLIVGSDYHLKTQQCIMVVKALTPMTFLQLIYLQINGKKPNYVL